MVLVSHPVALIAVTGILVAVVLLARNVLSSLDCIVLATPFMFFSGVTGALHMAAADLVLPFFALAVLQRRPVSDIVVAARPVLVFAFLATTAMAASALAASLRSRGFNVSVGVGDAGKIVVGLSYAILIAAWLHERPPSSLIRPLRLWVWLAGALSLGSVLTEVAKIPLIPTDGYRSFGFFQDPNLYAGYLLVSLCVTLVAETLQPSILTPLFLMTIAAGVVMTASRSGVATLGVLLAVTVIVLPNARVRIVLLPVGLAGVWLARQVLTGQATLTSIPALDRLFTSSQVVDSDPRFTLWSRAIELWHQHPILGVGIGQFATYSGDILGVSSNTGQGFVVHNTFISFLTEVGIVGLILCVGGFVGVSYGILRTAWLTRSVRFSLMLGILVIAAQMGTLNLQNLRYVWVYLGMVLGLMANGRRGLLSETEPEHLPEQIPTRRYV